MRSICLLLLAGGLACRAAPDPSSVPAESTDAVVRREAARFMTDSHAVGISIGVVHRGRVRSYGFGVAALASRAPATSATSYPIASITKTFTGALLARAVVEGRVGLDDDVRRYLDGSYPNLELGGRPVTLRALVTHTARLPFFLPDVPESRPGFDDERIDWSTRVARLLASYSRDDFYRDLAHVTLDSVPGTSFRYSNAGFQLLGFVLERVYGRPYAVLVDSLITRPLGMRDTRLGVSADARALTAVGYDERHHAMPIPARELQGAGAISSTVDDMLRYARWQIAERDDAVRLSHQPVWGDTLAWSMNRRGYAVGYNWQMLRSADGVRRIFQDGNVPGYSALCVVFPELDLGIVVLSNELDRSTPARISALADSIAVAFDPRGR